MAAEADVGTGTPGLGRPGSPLTMLRKLRSHAVRRMGWGLADQIVSSLTNFAISIYVVHSLGAVQFGAFSLAYVTYGFALNASRGLATDPLMVRFSGIDGAHLAACRGQVHRDGRRYWACWSGRACWWPPCC